MISSFAPFLFSGFRIVWTATIASNLAVIISQTGAAWVMTTSTTDPFLVALVQSAAYLPMATLCLLGGLLSDTVDRRTYLIGLQSAALIVAVIMTAVSLSGSISASLLLILAFAIGTCAGLSAPAWQALVPDVVPSRELANGVTLKAAGFNVSRALGPAIAGAIIAVHGADIVFLLSSLVFAFAIGILFYWKLTRPDIGDRKRDNINTCSIMSFISGNAVFAGILTRSFSFFFFASATLALLPVLARERLLQSAEGFGLLLAVFGICAALAVPVLALARRSVADEQLVLIATLSYASSTLVLAYSTDFEVALAASGLAGGAWIAVLSSLNTAVQRFAPTEIRGRALSVALVVFSGSMAGGGALWGYVAARFDVPFALAVASCGLVLGCLVVRRFRLSVPETQRLGSKTAEVTMAKR